VTPSEMPGYVIERNATLEYGSDELQADLVCNREGLLPLCVEIKNILSDVILDPAVFDEPSSLYRQIEKHFSVARDAGMIPVLFAPFVNRSFYLCCDRYRGLFCQTLTQLLPPGEDELLRGIKEELHFRNVRIGAEAPANVSRWIGRIPSMWVGRYG